MKLSIGVGNSIATFTESEWDACAGGHPFVRHAFFRALEESGSVRPQSGVVPKYVGLRDETGTLIACVPAMFKWSNKREFGPEIKWLKAGAATGCFSWPKFQVGVPLFPVMGPRLLVRQGHAVQPLRTALIKGMHALAATRPKLAALNIMHVTAEHAVALQQQGWLISHEVRSAWHNPGYTSPAEYLASLPHRKRYLLAKERRSVKKSGVTVSVLNGTEVSPAFWSVFYDGYAQVCARYGNKPWLPEGIFGLLARYMPESIRVFAAFDGDRYLAGVFCLEDATTLYAQTWSALHHLPELCFELVCYRPFEYAIENRIACIDGGVTGRHKTQRGYTAERIANAHWFYNDDLKTMARAVIGFGDNRRPDDDLAPVLRTP
jgi:uncharacterized protein